uniref:Uncharacterized protein n=1 Tax=viral metagenome TaxID=1070528 RepID=A0A6M3X4D9_9ZZZZ
MGMLEQKYWDELDKAGILIHNGETWIFNQSKLDELQKKAHKYDFYHLQLIELEKNGVWGAINKLQNKLDRIEFLFDDILSDGECYGSEYCTPECGCDPGWEGCLTRQILDIVNEAVESDGKRSDQDDGKYEADWDEERGKYR